MNQHLQDMASLPDYHWLFTDEPMASLPDYHWLFTDEPVPADEPPSSQSHESTSSAVPACPSVARNESRAQASSPTFRPQAYPDHSCNSSASECSTGPSLPPLPWPKRASFSPAPIVSVVPQYGSLKRPRGDYYDPEDFPRKRRHPPSPVYVPNDTYRAEQHQASSPVFIPNGPNLGTWPHPHHPSPSFSEASRYEQGRMPEQLPTELDESKRCMKFLVDEIMTVIECNRGAAPSAEMTQQAIRRTERRLISFVPTSPLLSQCLVVELCVRPRLVNMNTYNPILRTSAAAAPRVPLDPVARPSAAAFTPASSCATPFEASHDPARWYGQLASDVTSNSGSEVGSSTTGSHHHPPPFSHHPGYPEPATHYGLRPTYAPLATTSKNNNPVWPREVQSDAPAALHTHHFVPANHHHHPHLHNPLPAEHPDHPAYPHFDPALNFHP